MPSSTVRVTGSGGRRRVQSLRAARRRRRSRGPRPRPRGQEIRLLGKRRSYAIYELTVASLRLSRGRASRPPEVAARGDRLGLLVTRVGLVRSFSAARSRSRAPAAIAPVADATRPFRRSERSQRGRREPARGRFRCRPQRSRFSRHTRPAGHRPRRARRCDEHQCSGSRLDASTESAVMLASKSRTGGSRRVEAAMVLSFRLTVDHCRTGVGRRPRRLRVLAGQYGLQRVCSPHADRMKWPRGSIREGVLGCCSSAMPLASGLVASYGSSFPIPSSSLRRSPGPAPWRRRT